MKFKIQTIFGCRVPVSKIEWNKRSRTGHIGTSYYLLRELQDETGNNEQGARLYMGRNSRTDLGWKWNRTIYCRTVAIVTWLQKFDNWFETSVIHPRYIAVLFQWVKPGILYNDSFENCIIILWLRFVMLINASAISLSYDRTSRRAVLKSRT